MQVVSNRLIGARKAKGLTQQELAERLAVSLRTVQNWEAGLFEPQGKNLRSLSEVLQVGIPYLMGDEQAVAERPDLELKESSPEYGDPVRAARWWLDQVLEHCRGSQYDLGRVLLKLMREFPIEGYETPEELKVMTYHKEPPHRRSILVRPDSPPKSIAMQAAKKLDPANPNKP
jgi:transcriptional regulator with XRE-family HTH domain